MKAKNKVKKVDSINQARNILIAMIVFSIVTSLLLLLMASVVTVQNIPHNLFPFMSIIVVTLSSFLSSLMLAKLTKEKGLFNGLILGVVLAITIYIVGLILNGIDVGMVMYIKTVAIILASCLGGVLGVNLKRKY